MPTAKKNETEEEREKRLKYHREHKRNTRKNQDQKLEETCGQFVPQPRTTTAYEMSHWWSRSSPARPARPNHNHTGVDSPASIDSAASDAPGTPAVRWQRHIEIAGATMQPDNFRVLMDKLENSHKMKVTALSEGHNHFQATLQNTSNHAREAWCEQRRDMIQGADEFQGLIFAASGVDARETCATPAPRQELFPESPLEVPVSGSIKSEPKTSDKKRAGATSAGKPTASDGSVLPKARGGSTAKKDRSANPKENGEGSSTKKRMQTSSEKSVVSSVKRAKLDLSAARSSPVLLCVTPDGNSYRKAPVELIEGLKKPALSNTHLFALQEEGSLMAVNVDDLQDLDVAETTDEPEDETPAKKTGIMAYLTGSSATKKTPAKPKSVATKIECVVGNKAIAIVDIAAFGDRAYALGKDDSVFAIGDDLVSAPVKVQLDAALEAKVAEDQSMISAIHPGGTFVVLEFDNGCYHVQVDEDIDPDTSFIKTGTLKVPRGRVPEQVYPGGKHCLVLTLKNARTTRSNKSAGMSRLFCLGSHEDGQLGLGRAGSKTGTFVEIKKFPEDLNFIDAAAGTSHSFAIDEDGSLYVFGTTLGATLTTPKVLGRADDDVKLEAIVAGNDFAIALDSEGMAQLFHSEDDKVRSVPLQSPGDDLYITKVHSLHASENLGCLWVDIADCTSGTGSDPAPAT